MKYYKIQAGITTPYKLTKCPKIPKESPDDPPITFRNGLPIEAPVPNPMVNEVNYPDSITPHPYLERFYPIVNSVFLDALKRNGVENYEIFPTILHNPTTNTKWSDYFTLNVIGLLDAALLTESKCDVIAPGNAVIPSATGFRHYIFSAEKLKTEPRMFRLWHSKDLFISFPVMQGLKSIMPLEKWNISATEIEVRES